MIKFFRFSSGENVVADTDEVGENYFLKWPVQIIMVPNPDAPGGVQSRIEPFAPHVKGHSIYVAKNKVLFTGDPIPQLQEYYEKNFLSMIPQSASNQPTLFSEKAEEVAEV